ncbi:acyltransferase [Pedobacter duraquae]|uniref:Acetyltransferase-like isoleucine patch superfamily enzyme n=1 Tax=Pedobacter duraquae TaxID=425511 RepID=A0A4R6IJ13_9SPHI|nr:DapH/DapD/GlmU-related protein [Pedobacter duraquae]TDO21971.1 acetyltransferase-like isoleucine patch superfamily enzyme [Pedobacter duraquae]
MRNFLSFIVQKGIIWLSSIFTLSLVTGVKSRINSYYTIWLKREFRFFGANSGINRPIYLNGGKYITIGQDFHCDQRLRLEAIDEYEGIKYDPEIIIGNHVMIQKDCHIGAINKIQIGHGVLIASKVFISDHSHGEATSLSIKIPPLKRPLFSKGPVIIEDNVWIGEGVIILPGVTIGENSIIAAGSVVTKSIPSNCVAAGSPTKIIKELD